MVQYRYAKFKLLFSTILAANATPTNVSQNHISEKKHPMTATVKCLGVCCLPTSKTFMYLRCIAVKNKSFSIILCPF